MAAVPPRMRSVASLTFVVLAALIEASGTAAQRADGPRRIISLVPATTEMLFAMGAGDRLAGVSSYDRFPPEVARLPRVGGLLDPDVERVLSLTPDLVIVYETQTDLNRQLERAGIPIFGYRHRDLADVTETMRALGDRIGAGPAADAAASLVEKQLAGTGRRVAGRPRPNTLLVFGREQGTLRHINASGVRLPPTSSGRRRRQRTRRSEEAGGRHELGDGSDAGARRSSSCTTAIRPGLNGWPGAPVWNTRVGPSQDESRLPAWRR